MRSRLECFQEKHAPAKAGVDTGFPGKTLVFWGKGNGAP